jgi:hypothetical protein
LGRFGKQPWREPPPISPLILTNLLTISFSTYRHVELCSCRCCRQFIGSVCLSLPLHHRTINVLWICAPPFTAIHCRLSTTMNAAAANAANPGPDSELLQGREERQKDALGAQSAFGGTSILYYSPTPPTNGTLTSLPTPKVKVKEMERRPR